MKNLTSIDSVYQVTPANLQSVLTKFFGVGSVDSSQFGTVLLKLCLYLILVTADLS